MIHRRVVLSLAAWAALSVWPAARADGLASLDAFLRQTQQGKASFTQTVVSPPRAGEATPRTRTSRGTFEFQRPDRFRFIYTHPFEQTIAADGQTLWIHDVDLNQVTASAQRDVLSQTPAALIAASPDLVGLKQAFDVGNAPDADGLSWVLATPRQREGQLQSIRLGFRQSQLVVLDILDSFGQRSTVRFGDMDTRPGFGSNHFRFDVPEQATLIRQ